MKERFPAAILFFAPCLTAPAQAALVAFPEIVITSVETRDISTGGAPRFVTGVNRNSINPLDGFGAYTLGSVPGTVTISAGDTLAFTVRAAPGMVFQLEPVTSGFVIDLDYRAATQGQPNSLSDYSFEFGGLSGGTDPASAMMSGGIVVGPWEDYPHLSWSPGVSVTAGLIAGEMGSPGTTLYNAGTFDSITFTGTAQNLTPISFSTDLRYFSFFANELSLVPVPEPSTAALFGLAGTLALTRRRIDGHS
ncbi:PEP-CTERM sorting domain-containing protein [Luteolibacter marinus]|uniref:PEP-CTERM sorting domain-containing protein n=1 Tax=Luteolibacter marinus TaxID=2776705 RepID=UPI001866F385|nr:PEP-CTERM sorting domain-containing protein [Luteolibacter marinus]